MKNEKEIIESLVSKISDEKETILKVYKWVAITPEESYWAENHQEELMKAISEAAMENEEICDHCTNLEIYDDAILVDMENLNP